MLTKTLAKLDNLDKEDREIQKIQQTEATKRDAQEDVRDETVMEIVYDNITSDESSDSDEEEGDAIWNSADTLLTARELQKNVKAESIVSVERWTCSLTCGATCQGQPDPAAEGAPPWRSTTYTTRRWCGPTGTRWWTRWTCSLTCGATGRVQPTRGRGAASGGRQHTQPGVAGHGGEVVDEVDVLADLRGDRPGGHGPRGRGERAATGGRQHTQPGVGAGRRGEVVDEVDVLLTCGATGQAASRTRGRGERAATGGRQHNNQALVRADGGRTFPPLFGEPEATQPDNGEDSFAWGGDVGPATSLLGNPRLHSPTTARTVSLVYDVGPATSLLGEPVAEQPDKDTFSWGRADSAEPVAGPVDPQPRVSFLEFLRRKHLLQQARGASLTDRNLLLQPLKKFAKPNLLTEQFVNLSPVSRAETRVAQGILRSSELFKVSDGVTAGLTHALRRTRLLARLLRIDRLFGSRRTQKVVGFALVQSTALPEQSTDPTEASLTRVLRALLPQFRVDVLFSFPPDFETVVGTRRVEQVVLRAFTLQL